VHDEQVDLSLHRGGKVDTMAWVSLLDQLCF
jgi:hypothetical protein